MRRELKAKEDLASSRLTKGNSKLHFDIADKIGQFALEDKIFVIKIGFKIKIYKNVTR